MRKAAIALVVLVIGALPVPALALDGARARIVSPTDGQVVSGMTSVRADGSATLGVKSVELFIEDTLVAEAHPSSMRQSVDVGFDWDTATGLEGGLSRNGWYRVRVEVTAADGSTDASALQVALDDPPRAPVDLNAHVEEDTVFLSWSPNPEPDIIGYRVEMGTDGSWSVAADVATTGFSADFPPGTYDFRVSAVRPSASPSATKVSAPSAIATLTTTSPLRTEGAEAEEDVGGQGSVVEDRTVRGEHAPATRGADAFFGDATPPLPILEKGLGIPSGVLPSYGAAPLPSLDEQPEWGTYEKDLPYALPQVPTPLGFAGPRATEVRVTAATDGAWWVGAGILMIVAALALFFASRRVGRTMTRIPEQTQRAAPLWKVEALRTWIRLVKSGTAIVAPIVALRRRGLPRG